MNIALTPHHKRYINTKVKSGTYRSPDEVVRDGLRLLEERDERRRRITWLQQEIETGFVGPTSPWTKSDSSRIRQLVSRRLRTNR